MVKRANLKKYWSDFLIILVLQSSSQESLYVIYYDAMTNSSWVYIYNMLQKRGKIIPVESFHMHGIDKQLKFLFIKKQCLGELFTFKSSKKNLWQHISIL